MTTKTVTQTASTTQEAKPQRRYDIDWLRVLAVLLLFPFHTARIFDTFGTWYVKNDTLSEALTYFIFYVHPWHMPLLFLLAGASTWFALSYRSAGQYTKERFIRLLIPFIFGLLVIVPPQSYLGLLGHTGFSGSYLEWYPNFFSINSRIWTGISWVGSRRHTCGLFSFSLSFPCLPCLSFYTSGDATPGNG